jgi:hypothetical protein
MENSLMEMLNKKTKIELLECIDNINTLFVHVKIKNYKKCKKDKIIHALLQSFHQEDDDICLNHYFFDYPNNELINIGLESNAILIIDVKHDKREINYRIN